MATKALLLAALLVSSPLLGQAVSQAERGSQTVAVNCTKGKTLSAALAKGADAASLEITFWGTCEEVVTIRRDRVTIRGAGPSALLVGGIEIHGGAGVELRDFNIRGGENHPHTGDFAGVNALEGSAVLVENVSIQDIRARGIQVLDSEITLRNVKVIRALGGGLTFRSARVVMAGTVVANENPFGVTLVNSGAVAKGADLTFNGNGYGMIIQISSGLEHISGKLTVNANKLVGILVAGQGVFAVGSIAEVRNNTGPGILVDELSSFTPLVGAPGGGPALLVSGNTGPGVSVERGSTFEVLQDTTITGNQVGINVDNSTVRLANAAVHGNNSSNLVLAFGAKGEFGEGNNIEGSMACDASASTRGSLSCGASIEDVSLALEKATSAVRAGVVNLDSLLSDEKQ